MLAGMKFSSSTLARLQGAEETFQCTLSGCGHIRVVYHLLFAIGPVVAAVSVSMVLVKIRVQSKIRVRSENRGQVSEFDTGTFTNVDTAQKV
jgi:hypothetical protein